MRASLLFVWSLAILVVACAPAAAEESPTSNSLGEVLSASTWATISPGQGGYQLRLLTDKEKSEAEQTVTQFRASSERVENNAEQSAAYRALPSDLRAGRYYKIRSLGASAVELKGEHFHAILPMTSVRIVLLGPVGGLPAGAAGQPSDSGDAIRDRVNFFQGLQGRGSFGRGGGGRGGPPGKAGGGAIGRVSKNDKEERQADTAEAKTTLLFLKYIKGDTLVDIIHDIYADGEARIAVEPRLNALIIHGTPKEIERIEQLAKGLDMENAGEPQPPEVPKLAVYSINRVDGGMVLRVLQTVLAGQPDVRMDLDIEANRIIVLAREADHETVKATIEELDSSR